jgi:hypothetical protein
MKHLKSKWRSTAIATVEITKLTLIDKVQKASYNEIHHAVKNNGLYYPIIICKFDKTHWMKEYNDPNYKMNDDGFIWGVYSGSSRLEYATIQGYDFIDAVVYANMRDAVNMDDWLSVCDPHHNHQCPPLKYTQGARIDYQKEIDRKTTHTKYSGLGKK